mmetsp:Transcript_21014/g.59775  ORF Transcript_21014/g.59775 Transcript_21014/m.59775 type:complete len:323 (-) Transcript_21014:626-1594(-)
MVCYVCIPVHTWPCLQRSPTCQPQGKAGHGRARQGKARGACKIASVAPAVDEPVLVPGNDLPSLFRVVQRSHVGEGLGKSSMSCSISPARRRCDPGQALARENIGHVNRTVRRARAAPAALLRALAVRDDCVLLTRDENVVRVAVGVPQHMILKVSDELPSEVPHTHMMVAKREEELVLVEENEGRGSEKVCRWHLQDGRVTDVHHLQVAAFLLDKQALVELLDEVDLAARNQLVLKALQLFTVLNGEDFERHALAAWAAVVDEQHNPGRNLDLLDLAILNLVQFRVVDQVPDLVELFASRVSQHFAVDVIKLDKPGPAKVF